MERWAKKKAIIFTPNGFLKQKEYDKDKLQIHKSGWSIDDFKSLGFKVYGVGGYKKLRGFRARIKYKPLIFWRLISDLTQKVVYRIPKFAFQLFAIKDLRI